MDLIASVPHGFRADQVLRIRIAVGEKSGAALAKCCCLLCAVILVLNFTGFSPIVNAGDVFGDKCEDNCAAPKP